MAVEKEWIQTIDLLEFLNASVALAVATTATVYTKSFVWPRGRNFGLQYRFAVDSGTPDVTVNIESGTVADISETASTDEYGVGNIIEANVADEVAHWKAPSPVVSPHVRFKLKGNGSNPATCTLAALKLCYTPED